MINMLDPGQLRSCLTSAPEKANLFTFTCPQNNSLRLHRAATIWKVSPLPASNQDISRPGTELSEIRPKNEAPAIFSDPWNFIAKLHQINIALPLNKNILTHSWIVIGNSGVSYSWMN